MSDMLIKLIGELSKLKYSDEKFNQLNIQYGIRTVRGKIVLEGFGYYNSIPIRINIIFRQNVTPEMVKTAYKSFVNILNIIHINNKLIKKLTTYGMNHNLTIKIEVEKSAIVKYNIITQPVSASHEVNFVEKESKFSISVRNMTQSIAKIITVLLTNPIRIYQDDHLIKIRELLYSLMIVLGENKDISIHHKFSTGNVVIQIKEKSSGYQKRVIIKFNKLILMTPKEMINRIMNEQ